MAKAGVLFVFLAVLAVTTTVSAYKPPHKKIGCGGDCSGAGSVCEYSLTCEYGTCKKLNVDEGHSCANTCEVCKSGLVCEHGSCKAPPIRCGEKCSYNGVGRCEEGSFCDGKKCIKYVGPGEKCDDCQVCYNGLECIHGKYHSKCSDWGHGGYH
jgi:hypothetical protein